VVFIIAEVDMNSGKSKVQYLKALGIQKNTSCGEYLYL